MPGSQYSKPFTKSGPKPKASKGASRKISRPSAPMPQGGGKMVTPPRGPTRVKATSKARKPVGRPAVPKKPQPSPR